MLITISSLLLSILNATTSTEEMLACIRDHPLVVYGRIVMRRWWELSFFFCVFTMIIFSFWWGNHKNLICSPFLFLIISYLFLLTLKILSFHAFSLHHSILFLFLYLILFIYFFLFKHLVFIKLLPLLFYITLTFLFLFFLQLFLLFYLKTLLFYFFYLSLDFIFFVFGDYCL